MTSRLPSQAAVSQQVSNEPRQVQRTVRLTSERERELLNSPGVRRVWQNHADVWGRLLERRSWWPA